MLTECSGCHRHHLESETRCPFCGEEAFRPSLVRRIATHPLVTATLLPVVLTACYGTGGIDGKDTGPNGETDDYWTDADEDGSYQAEDCDDENPDVYPGADEVCGNEIDDDCDDAVDEEDCVEVDTGDPVTDTEISE